MATFVAFRHIVTILVTDFTNPDNLTNDLLTLNSLIINKSLVLVGRRGLTDKSVDLRSRRQGTGDRIPVENKHVKKNNWFLDNAIRQKISHGYKIKTKILSVYMGA